MNHDQRYYSIKIDNFGGPDQADPGAEFQSWTVGYHAFSRAFWGHQSFQALKKKADCRTMSPTSYYVGYSAFSIQLLFYRGGPMGTRHGLRRVRRPLPAKRATGACLAERAGGKYTKQNRKPTPRNHSPQWAALHCFAVLGGRGAGQFLRAEARDSSEPPTPPGLWVSGFAVADRWIGGGPDPARKSSRT